MVLQYFARLLTFCLAGALLQAISPVAATESDDPSYLIEYRAYLQAARSGDTEGAVRHARVAWQSAEQLLGDDRHTAILAFNFGRLQLYRDADAALPALRRAEALQKSGVADLPQAELRLYLAYGVYATSGKQEEDLQTLRKALEASTAELSDGSVDLANIWTLLTTEDFAAGRFGDAVDSAASAEAAIRAAAPDDSRVLAEVILVGGAARLLPPRRMRKQLLAAHREFRRARRLFPPQKDIEHFDPLLAQVLAWDAAAGAINETKYQSGFQRVAVEGEEPLPPLFESGGMVDKSCSKLTWSNREPPEYPEDAQRSGYVGAVLIGYSIDDDLRVSDPKILAEVPALKFGYAAASSMSDWRLASPPSDDPACRRNLLVTIKFAFK